MGSGQDSRGVGAGLHQISTFPYLSVLENNGGLRFSLARAGGARPGSRAPRITPWGPKGNEIIKETVILSEKRDTLTFTAAGSLRTWKKAFWEGVSFGKCNILLFARFSGRVGEGAKPYVSPCETRFRGSVTFRSP